MSIDLSIRQAVDILRRGGLVAFPTETVYGLGADATNPIAIAKIFQAKGRPATNPLIVHVADEATARRYAADWPELARRMADVIWPGPLTIVVNRGRSIADAVTAGGSTVGLRVPNHPIAQELLRAFDGPIAAPSANRSEHVSPTRASHVADDLGDRVDLILDGGPCGVGIESTVVDATGASIRILRPGSITQSHLEKIVGLIGIETPSRAGPAASPGQHARHYAPQTPAYRFNVEQRQEILDRASADRAAVWSFEPLAGTNRLMPNNPDEYARILYQSLREIDAEGRSVLYIEMPPPTSEWAAVRDRLTRATMIVADRL